MFRFTHPTALLAAFCLGLLCALPTTHAEPVDADLLLKGGKVYDGAGKEPYIGNVAVRGDKIVAVGEFEVGKVGQTIDCAGLVVAPGWIDLHNHSDSSVSTTNNSGKKIRRPRIQAKQTRAATCYLTQGCTTIVTGNCGGGVVDTGRYYARLDKNPPGVNVAHLIPQGSVRSEVVGKEKRPATGEELRAMQGVVRTAMQDGAWGMSTGLIYVPSSYASTEEIAALAREVGQHGGIYASHIRGEGASLFDSVEEALEIGRLANVPVHVSHFKASKQANWGKVRGAAAIMQKAKDDGQTVTADQYPYAASSTSFAAMLLPSRLRQGKRSDLTERLSDPEQLAKLRKLIQKNLASRGKMLVAGCKGHPEWVGKMLRDIAAEEGRDAADVAIDIIKSGSESGVSFSMDERDVRWIMTLPWVATASDGSTKVPDGTNPHPRSYGTFPRRIGRYAIEEGVVPLEQAVRSGSGLPADILGLTDRGYLRDGCFADVVVFDTKTFRDKAEFDAPHQHSTGVEWLLVNGKLAIANGELKRTNAGRALRKTAASDSK